MISIVHPKRGPLPAIFLSEEPFEGFDPKWQRGVTETHLESTLYRSEPLDVTYFPNHFLERDYKMITR